MDFRGQDGYVLTHEEDAITGDLTVELHNLTETGFIGSIIIEPQKLHALAQSLVEISKQLLAGRADAPYKRRTVYTKSTRRAKTELFL